MDVNYCLGCMESITGYPCPHCGYSSSGSGTAYTLRPGTILKGKYLVGKVLGQGGFGITYIGMDLALERKVAIKEFYPANCVGRESRSNRVLWYDTPQARDAMKSGQEVFLKEARKMSRVSSVGAVVHVFDVFQENETAYICMEFIEGQTLQQMLKQTGPLPWEKARTIFLPVIQTMEQVHRQGLVHRDLSPDNLMIQPDGSVKILDLGAAKDLNLNSGKSSMQVAKGGFSPLEQYTSSGESGSWTDVYAIAATMYYALTGVVPPSSIDRANRDTLRRDLLQLQTLPPEVRKALVHALAVRIEDRIQTMAAFSAQLQRTTIHTPKTRELPPVRLVVAALIVSAVLGFGITTVKSGNDAPKKALSVPETIEDIPEITEAVSEPTETVPETMESVPETTYAIPEATESIPETTYAIPETTEAAPRITVTEAESLIAEIGGKTGKKLHSTYTEAVKLKKFWKSEGEPLGPGKLSQTISFGIDVNKPLYDAEGHKCGEKTYIRHRSSSELFGIVISDTSGNRLQFEQYYSDGTVKVKTRYFYDTDGTNTRTITIHYFSSGEIDYIYDGQSGTNRDRDHSIYIHFYTHNDRYIVRVKDTAKTVVLEKTYDSNGRLISSS